MHSLRTIILFSILCWYYSPVKCQDQVPYESKNIFERSSSGNLQCDQYANDLDILARFPFTVNLDYRQQGPDKSTAILDSKNSSVTMIQLRQAGAVVPESVFCLKNLQALDIMNMVFVNGIIPDALSNLQRLHSLSMTNTPIRKMTDQLATLQKLQSLSLDRCSLTQLPNLSGLLMLDRVSLPNNRLSKLEGLQEVSSLSLYKNFFTEIPNVAVPEALANLNMNFNPVTDMSIVTSFTNMTNLRLSEAHISIIPSDIDTLKGLYFLELSNNQITHVPRTILTMPYLQYLIVQRNPIPQEEIDSIKTELVNQQSKIILLV